MLCFLRCCIQFRYLCFWFRKYYRFDKLCVDKLLGFGYNATTKETVVIYSSVSSKNFLGGVDMRVKAGVWKQLSKREKLLLLLGAATASAMMRRYGGDVK